MSDLRLAPRTMPAARAGDPHAAPAPIRADGALWITFEEAAEALGTSIGALMQRAARGTIRTHLFPSEAHQGKTVQRVAAHDLPPALRDAVDRYLSRFSSLTPEACMLEIEAVLLREYERHPDPRAKAGELMDTMRARFQMVQQYRAIGVKSVVSEATGRRVESFAVSTLCEQRGVSHRQLQRWARRFDRAAGRGNTAEDLTRAFSALLPRKPGVANPDKIERGEDRRCKVDFALRLAIEGKWLDRARPDMESVWRDLLACCIRCHAAAMTPVDGGFRGRYKQHTCAGCGFTLSYSTVRRIINDASPAAACLARQGPKTYDDKFAAYAIRDWSGVGRSEIVFGDHHEIDCLCYDPRRLTNADGAPRLTTLWLSAWQCVASDVVGYSYGEQPNGELLGLAFRDYARKYGVPDIAWTDNGLDYLGRNFATTCEGLGTQIRQTLPSNRLGASHAKSKPVERVFGTLERDCVRRLPGWRGANVKERRELDDVHYRMEKQHEQWVRTRQGESPFLTIDALRERVTAWIESSYHKLPVARLDRAPLDAFDADPRPLRKVSERALDLLLMEARTRVVGRNGVEVDGHAYWSEKLFGREGQACSVRMDPEASKVIVLIGGEAIIAYAKELAGLDRGDVKREAIIKRHQRRVVEGYIAVRQAAAAGMSALDQVREERGVPEPEPTPLARCVNAIPVITPMHAVSLALDRREEGVGYAVCGVGKREGPASAHTAHLSPHTALPTPIRTSGPVEVPPPSTPAVAPAIREWGFTEEDETHEQDQAPEDD